ncbi:hypothetical protein G6F55_005447 [Rhizopus delemar]|uniref:NCA2-domain-containing protein n=1 Tax=Rhizopus delemar TaxID=936053 RepID=A0A9P7CP21_9FUNG|nr:hypothetical protein G6F55_005447 [Rhizopus delemar]KAG1496922.1 hypothetical protein G6F54_006136 [Rhizopus delemar]KAG1510625.1 hypothetical protein G6F53_006548 [Rhizopus delemar]KAG1569257.1 hypothetical protein G6F50_006546 [Rhizopus delemar]KAG1595882.1 hypothetical protein G6F48_000385 [Rhizopus delemar]
MDTFISEQIKRLDTSLDFAFTKHVQEYSSAQQANGSEFLVRATQELSSTTPLPFEKVRDYLEQFSQTKGTEDDLGWLFIGKCALAVYGHVFSDVLNLTLPVSESIDYWNSIEGSSSREMYYALQTMPFRLYTLFSDAMNRVQSIPSLFSSSDYLLTQLFPVHSKKSFSARRFFQLSSLQKRRPFLLQMIHEEIRLKREALEKFRSDQAANLGMLLMASPQFNTHNVGPEIFRTTVANQVKQSVHMLNVLLNPTKEQQQAETLTQLSSTATDRDAINREQVVADLLQIVEQWPEVRKSNLGAVQASHGIPSTWMRYWIPITVSYFVGQWSLRYLLKRRGDIIQFTQEFASTVYDFLTNWVWDPVKKVWETIRLKDQRLGLLSKQGLQSDLASLERMVVGFAKDNMHLTESDLAKLAIDIREGDISVVLKEYEKEIKNPLKNVILGDLLQAILIQIQKTKVDVDLAMSALDKLLKSNELNFAFLAVAPSMLVTWASASWLKDILQGKSKQRMTKTGLPIHETLRRIERQLIIRTPQQPSSEWQQRTMISEKDRLQADCETQGLLLCEIHLLRAYATTLPTRKNTRARFLEDIRDLENPNLTNTQKIQTIARMCRFWNFLSK